MNIINRIQNVVVEALDNLYNQQFSNTDFQINQTKPEFEGDYTVVLFGLLKKTGQSPQALGEALGNYLVANNPALLSKYNIIKGFLNFSIAESYWANFIATESTNTSFGNFSPNGQKVMVEYSSPNTNKPLHLGHLRNNFLGWSVAEILKATGCEVIKSSIVNDRGVHICKSMYGWQHWANGETPQSSGKKGDHLVGDYYVLFENELKKQTAALTDNEAAGDYSAYTETDLTKVKELLNTKEKFAANDGEKNAEKIAKIDGDLKEIRRANTAIMQEVKQMLLDWEAGKPEIIALWKQMNNWVYEGFDTTYKTIGCDFNKTYYESNTYLLGKDIVQDGLAKGIFFKKDDGSTWIDLTKDGLDEKLVLRKDGTSVYITQDLGLAIQKYDEYKIDKSIYVIADEQNYHMKVLQLICEKIGLPNAKDIHHLSYGMVELPSGRMKSREGTVVDADDIVSEMEDVAKQKTEELGKVQDFTEAELKELYHTIGLGALKFFLLRVDPKKRMIFNPEDSIDFQGFTGPYIQYNHARIKSVLRKNEAPQAFTTNEPLLALEKDLIVELEKFPTIVKQAADEMNPSAIAIYVYNIAKLYSSFFAAHSISNAESNEKKQLRLHISLLTANVIKNGMKMLGIDVPERM